MMKICLKGKLLIASCTLVGLLSGCSSLQSQNDGKPLARMTFEHIQPQPVYTASYEFTDESGQLTNPDKIYRGFADNPARVIKDYFSHRYAAAGTSGKLRVTLNDVSVAHTSQEPESAVGSILGVGAHDLYTIKADIELQLWGKGNGHDKGTHFLVTRDLRIPEHWSLADRQYKQMEALDHLVDDIDITVEKLLSEEFQVFRP